MHFWLRLALLWGSGQSGHFNETCYYKVSINGGEGLHFTEVAFLLLPPAAPGSIEQPNKRSFAD